METIVLTTANARYTHTSLGLRYLKANLDSENTNVVILEFTIEDKACDIAELILELKPSVVCMGVYVWNALLLEDVASLLKALSPETVLVLGGPEISFETEQQKIATFADYIIVGEGEKLLAQLIFKLQKKDPPQTKILKGPPPELSKLIPPYNLYSDEDIANRVIYLEATRGCPYGCEFCLSSRDNKVRRFSSDLVLDEIGQLLKRGVKKFKFVDRSIHLGVGEAVIDFFLQHAQDVAFVHFELVPERLSPRLIEQLRGFKAGSLQLEVGIQTLNAQVAKRIGRRQSEETVLRAIQTLQTETEAHLHTDLVAGLPGESLESFADGFDRLVRLKPHEIQIGILKRLRGAPISRHTDEWEMIYNPKPPYDILQNKLIGFKTMQRLKRFARYFDLIYNSGNFQHTWDLLSNGPSQFQSFMLFSRWLYAQTGRTHAISLNRLYELVFLYLQEKTPTEPEKIANTLFMDNQRVGRKSFPGHVRAYVNMEISEPPTSRDAVGKPVSGVPKRQQRHLTSR